MKILIGKPEEVDAGWESFPTDFLRPSEIRRRIFDRIETDDRTGCSTSFVTMNRTVLDLVRFEDGPICHEDVFVWHDGQVFPITAYHDADWMACFSLGDLFDHGEFDGAPLPPVQK